MPNKLTLDELDKELFKCADVLRGSIDSGRYKDFVLPLVFYAAVSQRYNKQLEKSAKNLFQKNYKELSKNNKKMVKNHAKGKPDVVEVPKNYTWQNLTKENEKIAKKIDEYFKQFEKQNKKFTEIFHNSFMNVESFKGEEGDQLLKQLINQINNVPLEKIPVDMLGEGYMNLVDRFSRAEGGEYFTPPNVVEMTVKLLKPYKPGSIIHDPTVGSGGMIIKAAEVIKENQEIKNINSNYTFTGQEKNPTVTGIAKMNLTLHGLNAEIKRGDSISDPQFTKNGELEKFDYILANFPFSQKGWKNGAKKRQEKYNDLDWKENNKLPHGNYGDYAFIMHMESQLEDTGRLATLIPHGVLFRNSSQEYRQKMIEEDWLEAIVGLPENLFESTSIPSGILVLNKNKPEERKGEVLFINADQENEFYNDTKSNRNELTKEGIEKVEDIHQNWKTIERTSRTVKNKEIKENDYNLNIALYVDTTEPQPDIDVSEKLQEYQQLDKEYKQLQDQFNNYMQQLNYTGDKE